MSRKWCCVELNVTLWTEGRLAERPRDDVCIVHWPAGLLCVGCASAEGGKNKGRLGAARPDSVRAGIRVAAGPRAGTAACEEGLRGSVTDWIRGAEWGGPGDGSKRRAWENRLWKVLELVQHSLSKFFVYIFSEVIV